MPGTEKRKFIVDMRDGSAIVTWENSGPALTFHLWTGEVDLTFIAGPEGIRQLRQMLSWAMGLANAEGNRLFTPAMLLEQHLARDGAIRSKPDAGDRPTVPPESYLG